MPFEWFVALRYLREGRSQSALILGAVSIGVGVLVFLTALMSGLEANLLSKTLGSQAHIVVHPPDEEAHPVAAAGPGEAVIARVEKTSQHVPSIPGWQQMLQDLQRTSGVIAASASVSGSGFVTRGAATKTASVRGIETESFDRIIAVSPHIVKGRYTLSGSEALIGTDLANDLGIGVGDKFRIVTADAVADVFSVAGIFDLGSQEVNLRWVLVPMRSAQTLFGLQGAASSIELKVRDVFKAEAIAAEVAGRTGLVADSWMKSNPQLLLALKSQASSTTIIQLFITLTVALGIASVLIVSVVQKSREIGILRAVGTQAGRVQRVFLIQGGLMGFVGAVLGSMLGGGIARLFVRLQTNPDGSPMFPVELTPLTFAIPIVLATAVGLIAAVVPARRAARLDPAEVIRYG